MTNLSEKCTAVWDLVTSRLLRRRRPSLYRIPEFVPTDPTFRVDPVTYPGEMNLSRHSVSSTVLIVTIVVVSFKKERSTTMNKVWFDFYQTVKILKNTEVYKRFRTNYSLKSQLILLLLVLLKVSVSGNTTTGGKVQETK